MYVARLLLRLGSVDYVDTPLVNAEIRPEKPTILS